jgi:hypothetical protein
MGNAIHGRPSEGYCKLPQAAAAVEASATDVRSNRRRQPLATNRQAGVPPFPKLLRVGILGSVHASIAIWLSVQSAEAATSARLVVWLSAVRERQYREGSTLPKPLVKASIEIFDQFVDGVEPASSVNLCRG